MPYWQLFYHLVWATKHREPLLSPQVAKVVYEYLVAKATGLGGTVYALGGVDDHVHMVVAIPPSISVARFVGQAKGVASAKVNSSEVCDSRFAWQESYGAFSFDAKRLPNYVSYVKRQQEHHEAGTIIPVLERMRSDHIAPRVVREEPATYETESAIWRAELAKLGGVSEPDPG